MEYQGRQYGLWQYAVYREAVAGAWAQLSGEYPWSVPFHYANPPLPMLGPPVSAPQINRYWLLGLHQPMELADECVRIASLAIAL
jgi:hypothetical protein